MRCSDLIPLFQMPLQHLVKHFTIFCKVFNKKVVKDSPGVLDNFSMLFSRQYLCISASKCICRILY